MGSSGLRGCHGEGAEAGRSRSRSRSRREEEAEAEDDVVEACVFGHNVKPKQTFTNHFSVIFLN